MNKLLFLLLPLFIACSARDSASSESKTSLSTAASTETSSNEAAQEVTISAPDISAKSGEKVCMDVQVNGFEQLLSMQYTLTWNKNVLQFAEIKNFQLPYLDQNDFGLHITKDGMLTCAWIDESLKGATVADGTSIYQVCFDLIGKAGEQSYFKITDRPTSIEVVNLKEKIVPLKRKAGSVTVQ